MNALLRSVKDTLVPSGTAVLWWLGQMGLLIKVGDTVLCVDYYASDSPSRQIPPVIAAGEMTGITAFPCALYTESAPSHGAVSAAGSGSTGLLPGISRRVKKSLNEE